MKIEDVRRVLVVGAGTMGRQIALQCAISGYHVTLYDTDAQALEAAMDQIKVSAERLAGRARLTSERADAAVAGISSTNDPLRAAEDADLLSESVPEDPELKRAVFSRFNRLCPSKTIFTTNTSTLVPSMLAEATGRKARFAALHFHDVFVSNVVDIMPHPDTAEETVDLLRAFAKSIDQIPIVLKKESHGYVFNALLGALNRAAIGQAADEVASFEDIDRAWMAVMKTPIGPFGIMDRVGLDTVWRITQYWAKMLNDLDLQKNADFVKRYVEENRLGVKSGKGFYRYPGPTFQQSDFLTAE